MSILLSVCFYFVLSNFFTTSLEISSHIFNVLIHEKYFLSYWKKNFKNIYNH